MSWRDELAETLRLRPRCGYSVSDHDATEPSSLSALALAGHGYRDEAERVANWLAEIQSENGTVGVRADESEPHWPTSLAVLVWSALLAQAECGPLRRAMERAVRSIQREPRCKVLGSEDATADPSLDAWPWVQGTYSWVEPTALYLLALRSAGQAAHARARQAVRMLLERQLPTGGWNYGNAIVLNRLLRPHVQPTGIALLALPRASGEASTLEPAIAYLRNNLAESTATASLCWGLLGLAAHGHVPPGSTNWLEAAYRRTMERDRSPHKLALIALACQGRESLPITLPLRPLRS